ncbi:MAG: hypothetical protein KGL75_09945 [Acidobacteriota bacterium]|nr:hypothetical protein [Acidobacteriota bacterium]
MSASHLINSLAGRLTLGFMMVGTSLGDLESQRCGLLLALNFQPLAFGKYYR